MRPDHVVILGDFVDCYPVSTFGKDHRKAGATLQHEVDAAQVLLSELRRASPRSQWVFVQGNHEDRIRRYLEKHHELAGLRCLTVARLLGLASFGCDVVLPYGQSWRLIDTVFTHGTVARSGGGVSGRAELLARGVSGVSGHTHRLAHTRRTTQGGHYSWVEAGCLCDLHAEYIKGTPDWQHGLAMGWRVGGRLVMRTVDIVGGEVVV
jgi:UDP-2,3-diacylglucosamine pyrophosphatase LpxH